MLKIEKSPATAETVDGAKVFESSATRTPYISIAQERAPPNIPRPCRAVKLVKLLPHPCVWEITFRDEETGELHIFIVGTDAMMRYRVFRQLTRKVYDVEFVPMSERDWDRVWGKLPITERVRPWL